MVKLLRSDIRTTEVLDWKGLHLFHFMGSSCSQKTRIAFNEKGVAWTSHHVDLPGHENFQERYLGINPRGLVPALVHDGDVHIESNDIIRHVDESFDGPRLLPESAGERTELLASMKVEDDLHLHLRALTFRYLAPVEVMMKDQKAVDTYEREGSGTVGGSADRRKPVEVAFWRGMKASNGITDAQVIAAVDAFMPRFAELDRRLGAHEWLLRSGFSALDIAWWITVFRVGALDFPLERFPRLSAWYERLAARPGFSREVAMPPALAEMSRQHQAACVAAGTGLRQLMAAHGR
ncbi:MAG: glutathione S-transferase family protein [Alphaproteobacteria bacterium]